MINKKELEAELYYLKTVPFYYGDDGMPSPGIIFLILLTGVLPPIIILYILRKVRMQRIRKELAKILILERSKHH